MQCAISQSLNFFYCLFVYVPEKYLQIPHIFLSFKRNIIWTCVVGPVMSPSVVLISFAKKVAIDFSH